MKFDNKRKVYARLYAGLAIVHLIMLIVFFCEGCRILGYINIASVVFYLLLSHKVAKEGDMKRCAFWCTIEVVAVAVTSTVTVGWSCGFMLYIMALIPIAFYLMYTFQSKEIKPSLTLSFVLVGLIYICLLLTYCLGLQVYELNPFSEKLLYVFNTTLAVVMLIIFSVIFIMIVNEETEKLKQSYVQLENSANIDGLTKLLNRRSLDLYLDIFFKKARGEGIDFSVLLCDLDDFKHINDTYGHECGDEVLRTIASVIKNCLRADDVVFRWGGEEILILVAGGRAPAKRAAERCREAIENTVVAFEGKSVSITVTIGVCPYFQGSTKEILIARADENLYKGKNNGKNQVVL